jgi:hypothetical protein
LAGDRQGLQQHKQNRDQCVTGAFIYERSPASGGRIRSFCSPLFLLMHNQCTECCAAVLFVASSAHRDDCACSSLPHHPSGISPHHHLDQTIRFQPPAVWQRPTDCSSHCSFRCPC